MEYNKSLFKKTINKINFNESTPEKENIEKIFTIKNIKVVILGQDPYPSKGVANGRAFAVNKSTKIPQSLKNIFKEIEEINGIVHADRTLELWEKQGVMLLNTSLTTKIGESNSHKLIWKEFMLDLIKRLNSLEVIWVLWGNAAQQYKKIINKSNTIIEDAHPSPLSVRHRNKKTFKILNKKTNIKW